MRIAVVDGQGGGLGKRLVEILRTQLGAQAELLALGTNALATSAMLRAGADAGATGENALCLNVARADIIVGATGILVANAMLGELTPAMAQAIATSPALKVLVPMSRCNVEIAGIPETCGVQELVEAAANIVKRRVGQGQG